MATTCSRVKDGADLLFGDAGDDTLSGIRDSTSWTEVPDRHV